MASIGFYRTNITPEKNALVENIGQYLSTVSYKKYVFDIQYFKHELETKIKLSLEALGESYTQNLVDTFDTYNYVGIANDGNDSKGFYYFITGTKWIAEKAIELELRMDTINTFQSDIIGHFTERTNIIRQHKNRFVEKYSTVSTSNNELERVIDRVPEGINPPLITSNAEEVFEENEPWILMYVQDDETTSLTSNTYVYAIPKNGMYVGTGGLTYLQGASCIDRAGTEIIKLIELPYAPFGVISSEGILPSIPNGWSVVAVTNSDKGFVQAGNVLRLTLIVSGQGTVNLNKPFETTLGMYQFDETTISLDLSSSTAQNNPQLYLSVLNKDMDYESKLYNSEFHSVKFLYDNFAREIRLEDFDTSSISDTALKKSEEITFYPSNNVTSKLMFKFNPIALGYHYISDYEEYLLSDRNLEPMRINDQFINYIRNGYNYDKKAHDIETTAGYVNFGVDMTKNALSAVTSGVAGDYGKMFGSFGSMVKETTNAITKELLYENSLQAKLAQLAAQGATVSGVDDLALLGVYNGNKLLINRYNPTDRMKEILWDTFYFTGYREDRKGIPNLTSRRLFNFIQCDPVFDNENKVGFIKYLDDIKSRFNVGVTVFHKLAYISQGATVNPSWDLNYSGKENWETFISPSIITIN